MVDDVLPIPIRPLGKRQGGLAVGQLKRPTGQIAHCRVVDVLSFQAALALADTSPDRDLARERFLGGFDPDPPEAASRFLIDARGSRSE